MVIKDAPTKCHVCGSTEISWFYFPAIKKSAAAVQGRLHTHDVACQFGLGCEECSETLFVIDENPIIRLLNGHG